MLTFKTKQVLPSLLNPQNADACDIREFLGNECRYLGELGGTHTAACSVRVDCPSSVIPWQLNQSGKLQQAKLFEAELLSDRDAFLNLANGLCIFKQFFTRKKRSTGN